MSGISFDTNASLLENLTVDHLYGIADHLSMKDITDSLGHVSRSFHELFHSKFCKNKFREVTKKAISLDRILPCFFRSIRSKPIEDHSFGFARGAVELVERKIRDGDLDSLSDDAFVELFSAVVERQDNTNLAMILTKYPKFKERPLPPLLFGDALVNVVQIGRVDLFVILTSSPHFSVLEVQSLKDAFMQASSNGHIEILKRLMIPSIFHNIDAKCLNRAFHYAIRNHKKDVIAAITTSYRFFEVDMEKAVSEALQHHNTQGLLLLTSSSRAHLIPTEYVEMIATYAFTIKGDEDPNLKAQLIESVISSEQFLTSADQISLNMAFEYACKKGLPKVVRSIASSERFNELKAYELTIYFDTAFDNNHYEVLEVLIHSNRFHDISPQQLNILFFKALRAKNMAMISIFNTPIFISRLSKNTANHTFTSAVIDLDLDSLNILMNSELFKEVEQQKLIYAFNTALLASHYPILQALLTSSRSQEIPEALKLSLRDKIAREHSALKSPLKRPQEESSSQESKFFKP